MPNPNSFVRVRSLVRFVSSLLSQLKKTTGQRLTVLEGSQNISNNLGYWFAGQVTSSGNDVNVAPFWVKSGSDFGAPSVAVSGSVNCPTPGVVAVVARHTVTWEVVDGLIQETTLFEGASLFGGASPPLAVRAEMTFRPAFESLPVEIIRQTNTSVTVLVLAALDTQRQVSHIARNSGGGWTVGQGLITVLANRLVTMEEPE